MTEIWVKSDIAANGAYVATLELSDDRSVVFDRDRATAYVWTLLTAIEYAEYDAAVYRQLRTKLNADPQSCAQMVADLRADRPSIRDKATRPLGFTPGVSAVTGQPFLVVAVNGASQGQWTMSDARAHAGAMLEAVIVADLDAAYYRLLIGQVGIEPERARNVVADIADGCGWSFIP